jgi:hypothetical protein
VSLSVSAAVCGWVWVRVQTAWLRQHLTRLQHVAGTVRRLRRAMQGVNGGANLSMDAIVSEANMLRTAMGLCPPSSPAVTCAAGAEPTSLSSSRAVSCDDLPLCSEPEPPCTPQTPADPSDWVGRDWVETELVELLCYAIKLRHWPLDSEQDRTGRQRELWPNAAGEDPLAQS